MQCYDVYNHTMFYHIIDLAIVNNLSNSESGENRRFREKSSTPKSEPESSPTGSLEWIKRQGRWRRDFWTSEFWAEEGRRSWILTLSIIYRYGHCHHYRWIGKTETSYCLYCSARVLLIQQDASSLERWHHCRGVPIGIFNRKNCCCNYRQ